MTNSRPQQVTLADRVVAYIHELVRETKLSPGDSLPTERQIAETLGVSRGPVREGMGRLRALGLVESRTKAGAKLVETSPHRLFSEIMPALGQTEAQLRELIEFRATIEIGAVSLAAARRTEDDVRALRANVSEGRRTMTESVDAFHKTDIQFHITILEMSGNRLLAAIGSVIGDFVTRASDFQANMEWEALDTAMADAQIEHEQIFKAICHQDVSAAATLMRLHMQEILEMAGIKGHSSSPQ